MSNDDLSSADLTPGILFNWEHRAEGAKHQTSTDRKVIALVRAVRFERDRVRTLEEVLRMAEPILAEAAEPEPMYGGFHGGDPRDFTPDPECSTEEERAKHRADCERWNRGEATGPEPDLHSLYAEGDVVVHVARCGYGLGTSMRRDERAEQALAAARRALSGDAQGGEG